MRSAFDVVVVGSANLDVRLEVTAIPRVGETVLAVGRDEGAGGKGANQAVAAARIGARTAFIGALGPDPGAGTLRDTLDGAGVDLTLVRTTVRPTGTAFVIVERSGENAIVVDPGANAELVDLTEDERGAVRDANVVLCQLEVPVPTVAAAAAAAGGTVILNAAPAMDLDGETLQHVDVLVVNEHEASTLSGVAAGDDVIPVLLRRVPAIVVTRGSAGAVLARRDHSPVIVPATPARQVVDTTGAGDTFCGVLAAAVARGDDLEAAARLAVVAAALCVERPGAAAATPTAAEVEERLADLERDAT